MPHHDHIDPRPGIEPRARPRGLAHRGGLEDRRIDDGVAEVARHPVDEAAGEVRVQESEGAEQDGVLGEMEEHPRRPVPVGDPVAVDGQELPVPDLELQFERREPDPHLVPESAAPAVVVAAGHHDRHPLTEVLQRRGAPKGLAGDDPLPGEEEVVDVAVQEEGVPQGGDLIEEVEERLLGGRGAGAEVHVLHDDELVTEHGG